ncbi:MAG: hypothetical protein ACI36Y_08635 [Coriobacteriales bacterium]
MEELADLSAAEETAEQDGGAPGQADLRPVVEERLRRMGTDPAFEKEKTLKQLERIQKAVDEEAERIADARRTAMHGMPLVRVVELTGIARQTFYNKPVLKDYAARAIGDAGIEEGRDEVARLKETVAELEAAKAAFVKRDGELVEERIKLRDARIEVESLKASLADANREIADLREMLEKAGGSTPKDKVVPMR